MTRHTLFSLMLASGLSLSAFAEPESPPPADPPAQSETESDEKPKGDGLGSLDELLGLDEADDAASDADDSADALDELDPEKQALEKKLTDQEVAEMFEQAVALMDQTATRLKVGRDSGLTTQRLQEDIIRKLDQLIEEAKNNQSSSSSSSSSQQQQQQSQNPGAQQQQQSQNPQPGSGDNRSEMTPPSRQDAQPNRMLDSAKAAWGALPARVRDLLWQGLNDQYSEMYGPMTEDYYRRIAEEGENP